MSSIGTPDSDASMKSADNLPARFALSFSGCGFLGCYHFGVVNCFHKNGKVSLYNYSNMIMNDRMMSMSMLISLYWPEN